MSDLVGNPEDRFSDVAAHIVAIVHPCKMNCTLHFFISRHHGPVQMSCILVSSNFVMIFRRVFGFVVILNSSQFYITMKLSINLKIYNEFNMKCDELAI